MIEKLLYLENFLNYQRVLRNPNAIIPSLNSLNYLIYWLIS
jgi:hypothetical protein